jgi:hypothetical protein
MQQTVVLNGSVETLYIDYHDMYLGAKYFASDISGIQTFTPDKSTGITCAFKYSVLVHRKGGRAKTDKGTIESDIVKWWTEKLEDEQATSRAYVPPSVSRSTGTAPADLTAYNPSMTGANRNADFTLYD